MVARHSDPVLTLGLQAVICGAPPAPRISQRTEARCCREHSHVCGAPERQGSFFSTRQGSQPGFRHRAISVSGVVRPQRPASQGFEGASTATTVIAPAQTHRQSCLIRLIGLIRAASHRRPTKEAIEGRLSANPDVLGVGVSAWLQYRP